MTVREHTPPDAAASSSAAATAKSGLPSPSQQQPWWKDAVVYQVYPASFKDSNGDGVGDLPGITSKLDYIRSLGATAVWICPMYDSPQHDLGYDISDYEAIYPPYGTLSDMEALIAACHDRGLRILLDLVVNHTSHLHPWFLESRRSRDSPKRDWYIWRPSRGIDPTTGSPMPPNNWRSLFGGSAWTWDPETEEFYLRLFASEQPDLNWDNTETRAAIYASAVDFWLSRGVDGFRVDTVNMYSKPRSPEDGWSLPDAPITDPSSDVQFAGTMFCNGPRIHEYLRELRGVMDKHEKKTESEGEPGGIMTVGELPHTPDREMVMSYVSARARQLSMVFQFDVVDVGFGERTKYDTRPRHWTLRDLKDAVGRTQGLLLPSEGEKGLVNSDGWPTTFLENHDQARSVTRFGSDRDEDSRRKSGKMLALLCTSLSGTLFVYQGQEIGMVNAPPAGEKGWEIEKEYKDVESGNYFREVLERTKEWEKEKREKAIREARESLQHLARDHARLPMCWDDGVEDGTAGFSPPDAQAKPWMRPHDLAATEINVAREEANPRSVLQFWKRMIGLRKQWGSALVYGHFEVMHVQDEHVFAFVKRAKEGNGTHRSGQEDAFVLLNFTADTQKLEFPEALGGIKSVNLVLSTYETECGQNLEMGVLAPWEGRLYSISNP